MRRVSELCRKCTMGSDLQRQICRSRLLWSEADAFRVIAWLVTMTNSDEGVLNAKTCQVYPSTVRYCRWCRAYTPHELRPAGVLCASCARTVLIEELERD